MNNQSDAVEYIIEQNGFDDFKYFSEKWISLMGLVDWKIVYDFVGNDTKKYKDLEGNRAMVFANYSGRTATIVLNKNWEDSEPTKKELERCAVHELAELLLVGLTRLAEYTFDQEVVEEEAHKIIRVMEKMLVP